MDRRQFLKTVGLGAVCLLGRGVFAAENQKTLHGSAKTAVTVKPPGTCGGYKDAEGDGNCDQSTKTVKPCGAVRCPGHVKNAGRSADAPKGACALWKDPEKKGFCAVSAQAAKPCGFAGCPAHKDHAA